MTFILCALALAACADNAITSRDSAPSAAALAAANPARPETDLARDASRKPVEVLDFLGVGPGMTVLDMFSGGGYYTEVLAYTVGHEGRVIAHSNKAYLQFVGDEFEKRYLGGRLANAEVMMAENNELTLDENSIDAVMLVLSFHDLFYSAPDRGWPAIDVQTFLAELRKGVKPGGFIAIIDHYAASGAPRETGNTTHRIDPAIVIEEMTGAGFKFDGQSDVLRNPDDNYDKVVFDPELRGKTDRFVMRFRNPG
jgi:predicted methyltransferase